MRLFEVKGTYGSLETPCTVLMAQEGRKYWYCVEGSVNVNCCYGFWDYVHGQGQVNVEDIKDIDCFTWSSPILSLEDLELAVEG